MFNKTLHEWGSEIDKLQSSPHVLIQKALRVSYDGLDADQKNIFLDIACFFKGEKKDYVQQILDGCELFYATNLRVLADKSLITICEDRIQMHNLVQEMGWQIVREESQELGNRSRLWHPTDVCDVLKNDKGTELVKGLALDLSCSEVDICCQSFTKLKNLRLLYIYIGALSNFRDTNGIKFKSELGKETKVSITGKLEFLSNELQMLCWHRYPFQYLPSTFFPESLLVLDMSYSCIKEIWSGSKGFKKLTLLNLSHCLNLRKTPDFTGTPNLKELILDGCENLVKIHPSVGTLKLLILLNLKNCKNLKVFPSITEMESLKHLILSDCSKMQKLPEDLIKIKALVELRLDGTAIKVLPKLPSSIRNLDAQHCTSLQELPKLSTMYNASSSVFDFKNCPKVVEKQTIESLVMVLLPQGWIDIFKEVHIFLPGSRIPRWFSNQSMGDCIMVNLPPHWCYKKLKGLVTCAVIVPENTGSRSTYFEIFCTIKDSYGTVISDVSLLATDDPNIESDQIWFCYRKSDPKWKKTKNHIIVSFKCVGINCKVKQCGVILVWEEDEQEAVSGSKAMLWFPTSPAENDAASHSNLDVRLAAIEDEPPWKKFRIS